MKMCIKILFITLMFASTAYAELPSASDATVQQALRSGKPAVIDLGARYCLPCKKMAPILESLSSEYKSRASVIFIDVHEDQSAVKKFRIQMIPTQCVVSYKKLEMGQN